MIVAIKAWRNLQACERSEPNLAKNLAQGQQLLLDYLSGLERESKRIASIRSNTQHLALAVRTIVASRKLMRGKPQSSSFVDSAMSALRIIASIADDVSCPVFLISGTLLGDRREGKLLAHDIDLDFGVLDSDLPAYWRFVDALAIHPEVLKLGVYDPLPHFYQIYPPLRHGPCLPLKTLVVFKNGVVVDVMRHFLMDGALYHGSPVNLWKNSPFDLKRQECLAGISCNVPENEERYLVENYGDWRTPLIDYVNFLDTPNWEPTVTARALRQLLLAMLKALAQRRYDRFRRIQAEALPKFDAQLQKARERLAQRDSAELVDKRGS